MSRGVGRGKKSARQFKPAEDGANELKNQPKDKSLLFGCAG
jgi:hypothetical protein